MTTRRSSSRWLGAFSLVELLVVISVIAIVAGFAVPAVTTMVRGSAITQASQLLTDHLALARQTALSRNRTIEVRFYKFGDPEIPGEDPEQPESGAYHAFQSFEILENGAALPLGKIDRLPRTVIMNETKTYSTLIKGLTTVTKDKLAPSDPEMSDKKVGRNYQYVALRFKPDGSTDLPISGSKSDDGSTSDSWFVTLHDNVFKGSGDKPAQTATLPGNFFTLQIEPVSGTTRAFRPNAG